ncbi:uncharacterized protein DDB_G0283697, partial [Ceratina calcarata]|uniref:Uncharacterized protein DDB_G0283697 n=1 Tax=Ceratina calcarata TaxID=156304 RepID=A0AAJ7NDL0_9HYME
SFQIRVFPGELANALGRKKESLVGAVKSGCVPDSGRRKPKISQLVCEYLNLGKGKEGIVRRGALASPGRCRFCNRAKAPREEVLDSVDSRATNRMANKRKDSSRNSKVHHAKRRPTPRDQSLSSCMHKVAKGEGVRKMKTYIQRAIDFGVESGYLIPKDAAYRVLRVSSDLMKDTNYKVRKYDARSSRRTPIRFEDYEVQDARRRRSRRRRRRSRRRRSGSRRRRRSRRRRGRRRDASGDEEVVEVDNEEYEDDKGEKRRNVDNVKRDDGNEQMNQSDGEKTANKRDDDGTEMSMDEEESEDEEDDKKREDTTKS